MAHQVDRAALWLFVTFSAFLLMLVWTDGRIFLSSFAAFCIVCLIRILTMKLSDRQRVRRRKRLQFIANLLRKWAIMPSNEALLAIEALLPELFSAEDWPRVRLIQRLPDGEMLTANDLLELWRGASPPEPLLFIATVSADSGAFSLLEELSSPSVRLIDAAALTRRLLKVIRIIPVEERKRERRVPLSVRIARLTNRIRPIRTSSYLALFLLLYLLSRSVLYLIACAVLAGLLVLRAYSRIRIANR